MLDKVKRQGKLLEWIQDMNVKGVEGSKVKDGEMR